MALRAAITFNGLFEDARALKMIRIYTPPFSPGQIHVNPDNLEIRFIQQKPAPVHAAALSLTGFMLAITPFRLLKQTRADRISEILTPS